MPISASLMNDSRKKGIPGFYGRAAITDDLITRSLENKLANDRYKTDVAAKTDLTTNAATIEGRAKEAALGRDAQIQQENIQQKEMTARQKITEAGNLAVQELQGRQATSRIGIAGEEARKTKKSLSGIDEIYTELLKGQSTGAAKKPGYEFKKKSALTIDEPDDIEEYLNVE